MNYRLVSVVGFWLIVAWCVSIQAAPLENSFLIVDGANDVQEYQVEDGRRFQVNYSVVLEYPSLAINEPQWEQLKKNGWSRCAVKKAGWDTFPDIATGDGRTVHRYTSYWAKNNRLITISLNYYSVLQEPSKCIEPDNSTQHVVVLFDTYDDIGVVEERLAISCP